MKTTDKVQLGFWLYLMSDCVLFAGLFATYAVLRGAAFGGPDAYELLNLPLVLTETLILLASSFTMGLTLLAARAEKNVRSGPLGQVLPILFGLAATLMLGLTFVGIEVSEFRHLILEGNGPSRSAFLSSFFALVGTHGLHVTIGSLVMVVFMAQLWAKGLSERLQWRLLCLGLFWHFL